MIDFLYPQLNHYYRALLVGLKSGNRVVVRSFVSFTALSTYPWQAESGSDLNLYFYQKGLGGVDWKHALFYRPLGLPIVAGWADRTNIILLIRFIITRKRFAIYSDTPRLTASTGLVGILRRWYLKIVLQHATWVMSTGNIGLYAFKRLGVNPVKLVNFPFYTDLERFKPASWQVRESADCLVLFSSGRLDIAHKGYDIAIHAVAKFLESRPDVKMLYKIAGVGPDEGKLKAMVTDKGLNDVVIFLGWQEIEALPSLYQQCDIMLHPSNFDPFPNAVLEAMACGCLVLGSDAAGSVVDRIVWGENGFIFKAGNSDDLAATLTTVVSLTESQRIELRKQARLTAESWPLGYFEETLLSLTHSHS